MIVILLIRIYLYFRPDQGYSLLVGLDSIQRYLIADSGVSWEKLNIADIIE
jgi:hypothetical protein